MRASVLCAVQGPGEGRLVTAIDAPGNGLQVVRRCADLAEVLALAIAGVGSVAVIDGGLPGVDRASLMRLREAGCRVVILSAAAELDRHRTLGADAVLPDETPAEAVVDAVRSCLQAERSGNGAERVASASGGDALASDGADSDERPMVAVSGRVLAVWGPCGAPGRTTLAVNVAAELAEAGCRTMLIDADTWGSSIAQTLGLLDESAGIAAAARAGQNGALDTVLLSRLSSVVQPGMRVLTGLSRPDRWRELTGAGLEVVLDTARLLADWTVVDCGFSLEDEAGPGFEAMLGPRRNGATLAALAAADVVLAVGSGEPVGIQRLVQGLAELADRGVPRPGTRRAVVLNKVRASAAGPEPERAVTEALVRYAGVPDPFFVPDDRAALDRAMLDGQPLRTTAPASPARLALHALALSLLDGPADRRRQVRNRRWRGSRVALRQHDAAAAADARPGD